ncbi:MAG: TonB-dependent receptor [Flavobacteriales bacterium]|nr:TonB-dependent receptor [Flavobacteriales bacterium]
MKNTLLIILFLPLLSFAQITQTIRGSVIDQDTKAPLIGANVLVQIPDNPMGAATDIEGNFRVNNVPIGRVNIKITYVGYEPKILSNVELTSAKELILNIELRESIVMNEVVIEADKKKAKAQNDMTTVSARTFSIDESMRYAGSLNDVARMAQNFAGVQGANDSRNDIVIRGNSPTGVLFRFEDIDIPNPNHFALNGTTGGPVSILNNNVLDNSDFMTGAFPAEYGNALAGVFDLKMRSGNNQKHEFLGQLGFNGLEFMAEGPISKKKFSSYLISYRYSTLKLFQLMGINFGTGTSVPDYQDLSFKLNFPNNKGKTTVWGIGGISAVKFLDSENEDPNLYAENGEDLIFNSNIGAMGVSNIYRINGNSFLKTSLSIDGTYNEIKNDTLNKALGTYHPWYRNTSLEGKQTLNFTYQNKISTRHLLKAGIYTQRRYYNLKDSVHIKSDTLIIPPAGDTLVMPGYWYNITNNNGATYLVQTFAQWQFRINEKTTLNTGVHGQYFFLNNTFALEPRIGFKYQFTDKNAISIAYGMHNQLAPNRLFFRQISDDQGNTILDENGDPYIPNRDLKMIRSNHFVISFDQSLGKYSRLKAEAYYQLIDNAPVQNINSYYSVLNYGANFDLTFPDTLINAGTGYNYGLEITLERFLNEGFYYLFTGSVYQSKYEGRDGVLRNTAFNGNYTTNFLIGKEFQLFAKKENAKATNRFVVDFKWTLNGGQRYIPIDLAASQSSGKAVYDFEHAFEDRYDDYFRMDLKIGYKRNGDKITQEWSINFQNLTNRKNIFQQVYDAPSGEIVTRYQTGMLPIAQYKILF